MSLLTTLGSLSLLLVIWFTVRVYRDDYSATGGQTRRQAIIEVWISIFIGFAMNWALNWFLLPLVGAKFTGMENFWLGAVYTLASVLRGYGIRRWAEKHIHHLSAWLSGVFSRA